jgi:hypothetical protein
LDLVFIIGAFESIFNVLKPEGAAPRKAVVFVAVVDPDVPIL